VITERTLRELGFTQIDPTCWWFVMVGKRIYFRVHFGVHVGMTEEHERKLAAYNTTDPTAQLYDHFDVNGDTMEDPAFRALFQRWKGAHRESRDRETGGCL
jgi:hypothetical protein